MTGGLTGSLIGAAALPAMGLGIPAVAGAAAVGLTGASIGSATREVFKNPEHRAEALSALGASARFGAQAAMAFGQFKLQSAAIGAQLTLGLMDRGLDAVEIFAGKGGSRPAKYDDLLKIADGRIGSDAPPALQDKAREVDDGDLEVALAAARSARFLELKNQEPEPELRAARVTEEVLAIEDGVRIYRPTPAQQKLLELEDRQRVLAIEDMDRRKKERGRQPAAAGPTIALGDRAASSRGGRRPETVEEKRKRHAEAARRTAAARSQADWQNMRRVAADTAGHARRVREQQFISAVQG